MTKLVWAFVLDNKGLHDIYTINGGIVNMHVRLHQIVAVEPTNPDLGSDCKHKLFHSNSDIIYPLELEKMIQCYNKTTNIVVNNGIPVVNQGIQVVN